MQTQSELLYEWGKGLDPCAPRVESAHDEFLVTDDGEELIDAAAGAAVVNLGHSIPGMTETLSEQSSEIAYLTLSHFKHDAPMRLARDLAAAAPDGLSTVFFTNSGSEANEAAFKLARAYHCALGDTELDRTSSGGNSMMGWLIPPPPRLPASSQMRPSTTITGGVP
ncbi:aminotransferase class III-fold pyridoxal phosphate-dependent enzyme [Haladaptatus sp.]|uniref:aminotransferase class III-fold pyridoxal phosphate-dependent enzyme n=1 Tax=Haladaptatus sp. TaxID=1973141 RepID=UPI003C375197